jgi:hypothetical protein
MKNHLKMLGLALCMLPMYLHAGWGEDLKETYQPVVPISAGTILPVSLNTTLRSDKSRSGTTIIATVRQDVPLGMGETLRAGSQLTGHVIETTAPGTGSDEAKISFQFDQVRFGSLTIPIKTTLRAIASRSAVSGATPEITSSEYADYTIEIGGDQISYGEGGPVIARSRVVGKYTRQGVLAYVDQDSGTPSGGSIDDNSRPQAFWLFSVNASGAYGFGNMQITHSGSTEPLGQVTLASNSKAVKVGKGSAMLLLVDGSGPDEAHAGTTASRGTGQ